MLFDKLVIISWTTALLIALSTLLPERIKLWVDSVTMFLCMVLIFLAFYTEKHKPKQ